MRFLSQDENFPLFKCIKWHLQCISLIIYYNNLTSYGAQSLSLNLWTLINIDLLRMRRVIRFCVKIASN